MKWVISRKIALLKAIEDGEITRDEAKARHSLSEEELAGWEKLRAAHGPAGLRVTYTKKYRKASQS